MKKLNLRVEVDTLAHYDIEELVALFTPHFSEVVVRLESDDIIRYDAYHQKLKNTYADTVKVISMDPLYKGDYNIGISRRFNKSGTTFLGHYSRPETEMTLIEQFRQIPKGIKVVIFEDDIGYGGQIKRVKRILKAMNVEVMDVFTLYDNKDLIDEVLDARDFLHNAPYGGLVIYDETYESSIRVPYLFPYIDVKQRCSIDDYAEFSLKVWEFNEMYSRGYIPYDYFSDLIYQCECEVVANGQV